MSSFFIFYFQTSHMNAYAAATAAKVKGRPIRVNSINLTGCPSFLSRPLATILADAPIGVIFPPRLVPMSRPKRNKEGLIPRVWDIEMATGSIAASKGTFSTKAEINPVRTQM